MKNNKSTQKEKGTGGNSIFILMVALLIAAVLLSIVSYRLELKNSGLTAAVISDDISLPEITLPEGER